MEFLKKNRYAIIGAFLLVLALIAGLGQIPKEKQEPVKPVCTKATNEDIQIVGYFCAQQLDPAIITVKVCQQLKGTDDCQLNREEDGAAVELIILNELKPCMDKLLVDGGFCPFEIQ